MMNFLLIYQAFMQALLSIFRLIIYEFLLLSGH